MGYDGTYLRYADIRLVVNAGSVLEDPDQRGLAHLVEHMAFNGTTHFPKHALADYIQRIGMTFGADLNATTSFDDTRYQLTVPTDSAGMVEQGLRILEDWAHGIAFDTTEIRKERGVVIEEWRLGLGADARLLQKHHWIAYVGLAVILYVAVEMIYRGALEVWPVLS